ncbi:hypothetical protein [Sinorhizobium fredii]|uniref:Uncharacterized protein n=1 Tax=Rhizobium fredii TaxID=380 RepID=A0A2L0HDH9_RHIFR|nr:hypothetical protein [Sinorhizobium fredii]AUX79553.1 hypothetical protein NXT3_PC00388 [Sinorhizobium fredii]
MSRSGPAEEPQVIPVFTLVPLEALLIDIAGPLEVLRYTNLEQQRLRFDRHYIASTARQATSIGLRSK